MAGRPPAVLLRQMERWHAALGRNDTPPPVVSEDESAARVWLTGGIRGMRWKTTRRRVTTTWKIEALSSGRAPYQEGRAMHHCVASYADGCAGGECSIWSLKALVGDLVHGAPDRGGQPRPRDRAGARQVQRAGRRRSAGCCAAVGEEGEPDYVRLDLTPLGPRGIV